MRAATRGAAAIVSLFLAGACTGAGAPCICLADETPSPPAAWTDEITLNGFLATSWSYNFRRPASRTNQFRVFDFDDNTFKLDMFELVLQRPAGKPSESGFRVDVAFGGSVPRVTASAGLFRDDDGKAEDIDIQQAFASYVVPLGSGLRVDLGKFITHHGYEVIEGYDGWNDNATRSFLFGYAIPFTHVGARVSYPITPCASAMLMVVNGWDLARDNNTSKSVGGQLTLTPVAPLVVSLNGMIGPERADTESDPRRMLDVSAIWKATSRLTLGANGDWGAERNAVVDGEEAMWSGVAGYARVAVTDAVALSLRGEYFEDNDGARTGVGQTLRELTFTPETRLAPHLIVRGDFRVDRSNRDVFEWKDRLANTQSTVLLGAIYAF